MNEGDVSIITAFGMCH